MSQLSDVMKGKLYPKEIYFSLKQTIENPVWASIHSLAKIKSHGILHNK